MAKHSSGKAKAKKKTKKKGNKKAVPDAISMKLKAQKPNPFETIWCLRKFDILGKKRKGEERRVGLARSLTIQKMTKTLSKEYEQSTKPSVFVDKRIGEQNDDLREFEKVENGQKEQVRLIRWREDEFEAPDFGSLLDRDDFEDEMLSDDDNDDDVILSSYGAESTQGPVMHT